MDQVEKNDPLACTLRHHRLVVRNGRPYGLGNRDEYSQYFTAAALCRPVYNHSVRSSLLVPGPGTDVLDSAWRDRLHLGRLSGEPGDR